MSATAPACVAGVPLRVGVLVDPLEQPAWVLDVIASIRSAPWSTVALLIVDERGAGVAAARPASGIRRAVQLAARPSRWLFALYTAIDEKRSLNGINPFRTATPLELECPTLRVEAGVGDSGAGFSAEFIREIQRHDLDVVVHLGSRPLDGSSLDIAKHGVWMYQHGDRSRSGNGQPPAFRETMDGTAVTETTLWAITPGRDVGRAIQRSAVRTRKDSAVRNRAQCFDKSTPLVVRALRDLHEVGPDAPLPSGQPDPSCCPDVKSAGGEPSNLEMLKCLARVSGRFVRSRAGRLGRFDQWFFAYRFDERPCAETGPHPALRGLTPVVPPKDRFWADPFPVCAGGRYYVFVEEYLYASRKAHISVIEIERNGARTGPIPVLERPFHLSYPFVFEWRGDYFMCPESAQSGAVKLYRARSFPFDWQLEATLLAGVHAADPTLVEIEGRWWMFANVAQPGARDPSYLDDELHLFHAPTPLGPWTAHRRNPVKSDVRGARPAGRLFRAQGRLMRPAQDCSPRYGYAITVNRVEQIDRDEYREVPVSTVLPQWMPHLVCTHTINSSAGLVVIDGKASRRRYA